MDYIYVNGELYHYGIKGMKWGVRRFQRRDGSLTSAGRKRYSDDAPSKQKSTHRSRLEEKYRNQGMSQKEAEAAAERRIKTEKIIAITAGITVTAAAAYAANKQIQERADRIIKSGATMQRVTKDNTVNFDHNFYVSDNKLDNMKYRGLYGNQLGGGNKITLKADKDLKVVSNKKARDTFVDLYKTDPEFKTLYDEQAKLASAFGGLDPRYAKLYRGLGEGTHNRDAAGFIPEKILRKQGYDSFNRQLAAHDDKSNKLNKKFYDALRNQGYDAVTDLNDKKYSGFKTRTPTIIFNSKGKVSIDKVEELTEQQIKGDLGKTMAINLAPELTKAGALYIGAPTAMVKTNNYIQINKYRTEHPGTTMTDKEILQMLKKKK